MDKELRQLAKDILDKKVYICCPRRCGKNTFFRDLTFAIIEEQIKRNKGE